MLGGKKILLGVCGSIAAYKSALLVRLLVKAGAEVKVVMTQSATEFITPLTLSTLSKNPVLIEFHEGSGSLWNNHVELGLWADLLVIAPASANTIAKCSMGICDNLLSAVYLSARCPVYWAPAMDLDMYQHPSTFDNLKRLQAFHNYVIEAEHGELASGLVGTGRMAEPETIMEALSQHFQNESALKGKKVLITAGPTYETIDPVRFIGNHSTGKMGYALALEVAHMGAEVTLVSGPSQLQLEHPAVEIVRVQDASEMYTEAAKAFENSDIGIFAAAVADYTPAEKHAKKIKKGDNNLEIKLTRTKDIALELGKMKQSHQVTIGFALETDDEEANARKKLKSKNLDFIVLNSLNDQGAGFAHDTNRISIIEGNNKSTKFELKSKKEVARDIAQHILTYT